MNIGRHIYSCPRWRPGRFLSCQKVFPWLIYRMNWGPQFYYSFKVSTATTLVFCSCAATFLLCCCFSIDQIRLFVYYFKILKEIFTRVFDVLSVFGCFISKSRSIQRKFCYSPFERNSASIAEDPRFVGYFRDSERYNTRLVQACWKRFLETEPATPQ